MESYYGHGQVFVWISADPWKWVCIPNSVRYLKIKAKTINV